MHSMYSYVSIETYKLQFSLLYSSTNYGYFREKSKELETSITSRFKTEQKKEKKKETNSITVEEQKKNGVTSNHLVISILSMCYSDKYLYLIDFVRNHLCITVIRMR